MNDFDFKEWCQGVWAKMKVLPWKRIGLISLCVFLALVLISLVAATILIEGMLGQIDRLTEPTAPSTQPYIPDTIPSIPITVPTTPDTTITHKNLVNIMLVGQDRRNGGGRSNSDVMILCTFNTKDKSITLTSFMRDLYVNIPGAGMNKLNAAYPMGGYTLLGETLLENFGVKVDHYVEVDFSGFKKAVNILGGIDMYLTAAEAEYMNTTPWDGLNSEGWALHAGVNHLNGDMALAYSRIRAIGYDYERTERQRKVLTAMIDKCKGMDIGTAMNLMNQLLGCVRTDMTDAEITRYALELFPLLSGSLTQQRIPIEGSYEDNHNVIIPDYDMNHQFLVDTLMPD